MTTRMYLLQKREGDTPGQSACRHSVTCLAKVCPQLLGSRAVSLRYHGCIHAALLGRHASHLVCGAWGKRPGGDRVRDFFTG